MSQRLRKEPVSGVQRERGDLHAVFSRESAGWGDEAGQRHRVLISTPPPPLPQGHTLILAAQTVALAR